MNDETAATFRAVLDGRLADIDRRLRALETAAGADVVIPLAEPKALELLSAEPEAGSRTTTTITLLGVVVGRYKGTPHDLVWDTDELLRVLEGVAATGEVAYIGER